MKMMEWRETAVGTFVAEAAAFTLKIRRTANRQFIEFGVLKGREGLLASGTTTDIGAVILLTGEARQPAGCAPAERVLAKSLRADRLLERAAGAVTNMHTTTQSLAHRPAQG